jgi:hypothetical protein
LEIQETNLRKESVLIGVKSYTQYHIVGRDSLGQIDILRRYSEFVLLRDMLFTRYPGLVIPPLPAKKIQGKFSEILV